MHSQQLKGLETRLSGYSPCWTWVQFPASTVPGVSLWSVTLWGSEVPFWPLEALTFIWKYIHMYIQKRKQENWIWDKPRLISVNKQTSNEVAYAVSISSKPEESSIKSIIRRQVFVQWLYGYYLSSFWQLCLSEAKLTEAFWVNAVTLWTSHKGWGQCRNITVSTFSLSEFTATCSRTSFENYVPFYRWKDRDRQKSSVIIKGK